MIGAGELCRDERLGEMKRGFKRDIDSQQEAELRKSETFRERSGWLVGYMWKISVVTNKTATEDHEVFSHVNVRWTAKNPHISRQLLAVSNFFF